MNGETNKTEEFKQKSPKKIILISLSIILVLAVVIILSFFLFKKPAEIAKVEGPQLSDCETLAEVDPHCIAMVRENMSYCEQKPDKESVKLCYAGSYILFALLNKDVNECYKIAGDEDRKNICIALVNSDVSFCYKSSIESDLCMQIINNTLPTKEGDILGVDAYYWVKALRDKKEKYCDKIENRNDVDMCKAMFAKDERYCFDFFECYEETYSRMAAYWKDPSYCRNITDNFTRSECLKMFT